MAFCPLPCPPPCPPPCPLPCPLPSCAIPSCASSPLYGLGSAGSGGGLGLGGRGSGGALWGGSTSSGELGTLARVNPQPINQISSTEVIIQPPPIVVTIPGPILSTCCEPVTVGGHTPCAASGSGPLGRGFLGRRCLLGDRGNLCLNPCY